MIVARHGFKKRYAYGGSGIFDIIANFLTRIFTSSAGRQIASSALDVPPAGRGEEFAGCRLQSGKTPPMDPPVCRGWRLVSRKRGSWQLRGVQGSPALQHTALASASV